MASHSFIPDSSTRKLTEIEAPAGAEIQRAIPLSPPERKTRFSPRVRKVAGIAIGAVLLAAALAIAFRGPNYVSGFSPGTDSSVFLAVGYHMDHGRVLYRDTWDQKPPMIHIINAIALADGGNSIDAVRQIERGFGMAGAAFAFLAAWLAFRRRYVAFLAAVGFTLFAYHPLIYQGGNLTEFYGIVFFLGGVAAAIASRQTHGWRAGVLAALTGVAFGLCVLCKEPFLLSVTPWAVYTLWPQLGTRHLTLKRLPCLLVGAALPLGTVVGYFLAHGAIFDWIDVIAYNFIYARSSTKMPLYAKFVTSGLAAFDNLSQISWLAMPAMGLGLASVASREFRQRTFNVPVVLAADLLLGLLATSLSGLNYGHYYLQLVPAVIMLGVCGLLFCVYLIGKMPTLRLRVTTALPLVLAIAVLAWAGESKRVIENDGYIQVRVENAQQFAGFVDRLTMPFAKWRGNALVDYVRERVQPGQYLWCPSTDLCYIYAYADALSPTQRLYTFWYFFCDTPASTRKAKFQRIHDEVIQNPPQMVLMIPEWHEIITDSGLGEFMTKNYTLADRLPSGLEWRGNPPVEVWIKK